MGDQSPPHASHRAHSHTAHSHTPTPTCRFTGGEDPAPPAFFPYRGPILAAGGERTERGVSAGEKRVPAISERGEAASGKEQALLSCLADTARGVARRMARARGGAAWWVLAAAWVLWAAAAAAEAEARSPSARRVHRHLKRLNKPAVKSIEVLLAPSSVEFEMIALSSACSVELYFCHEGWGFKFRFLSS